jgi:C-methyltransferase C-terminal domain/Putative zinc binding domain/Methyltransferase domain
VSGPACGLCGTVLRHVFLDLDVSPLANRYLTAAELCRMEPFYPLRVYVCAQCFLVQLEPFESPATFFTEYAYFASYSDSWVEHARRYVQETISRFRLHARSQVVEIASNDGYLLQHVVAHGIPALGIEPAANVAEAALRKGIPTIVEFFGAATARKLLAAGTRADLLIGNNVLAHVPALHDFVSGIALLLQPDGVVTMEFPYLRRLIEEVQFDTIYHEHLSYFSFLAVERLFTAHGLRIFDVLELPTHGGSLRVFASHAASRTWPVSPTVAALRRAEQAARLAELPTYGGFAGRVEQVRHRLLEFLIAARRAGKSVVGYGAPAKGNTLLNYAGVRRDLVAYTVDRNPHKQGRFLPGSHLPIHDPDRITQTRPHYLLLLPWNLRDEIMAQMSHIREWGGQFVVPVPAVTILP